MCLDKGYDFDEVRRTLDEFGFTAHIRSRGEEAKAIKREAGFKARRWVVETHSWLNRFRRILVRWDKSPDNYIAFLHFACALEADLVDCMVALPGQLFYATQIPVCLWFLARDRRNGKFRDRRGEILFIDARKLGNMVDRTHRELGDEDIARMADTYHAWRSKGVAEDFGDELGFCKGASLEEVRQHGHVLTPGRYVGAKLLEDDGEPFEEKMARLTAQWQEQKMEAAELDAKIDASLVGMGFVAHRGTSR